MECHTAFSHLSKFHSLSRANFNLRGDEEVSSFVKATTEAIHHFRNCRECRVDFKTKLCPAIRNNYLTDPQEANPIPAYFQMHKGLHHQIRMPFRAGDHFGGNSVFGG